MNNIRGGNGNIIEHVTIQGFSTGIELYDDHTVILKPQVSYFGKYGINVHSGFSDVMIINPHILQGYNDSNAKGIRIHCYYEGQCVLTNPFFERKTLITTPIM